MIWAGFDFAMLLFECQRHSVPWSPLERWLFVDTLEVLRAVGVEDLGGCQKLQCLARLACSANGLRAHRALEPPWSRAEQSRAELSRAETEGESRAEQIGAEQDDCIALRGVMECLAARLGIGLLDMLRPFAVRLDAVASMAQVSVLCE